MNDLAPHQYCSGPDSLNDYMSRNIDFNQFDGFQDSNFAI